jgi:flavodoxin
MTKVLVPYYSSYGHVEKLAHEIGAREAGGVRRGEARA